MAFRVVLIENEVNIKLKLNNLIVIKEDKEIWIPIDDISTIVVDNLKINISSRMFSTLADNNVGVVICNQEHLPIGFFSSYDNHSRISKYIGYQINKSKEFYDKLWTEIVYAKLDNQRSVLIELGKSADVINSIGEFMQSIVEGDKTNREAHGAKIYFNELMGTTFSRGNEDILLNSGLDFGYSIIRSYIARLCVGYGLNTQLGIHHKNEYNRFNLVDDLIEPFRPIVDIYAYRILDDEIYFKPEHRRNLVNILNHKILYKNKKMYLCNVLEDYVSSFAALLSGKDIVLEYPQIINYIGVGDEI